MIDKLFNGLYSIKFDPYIGKDAFPVIIPLLQGQAADSSRLAFHSAALYTELGILKQEKTPSVFCLNTQKENVLARDIFKGYSRYRGINLDTIDIT